MAPRKSKRKPAKARRASAAVRAPRPADVPASGSALPLGATAEAREPWSRWAFAVLVVIVALFQVLLGLLEYLLVHDNLVFDLINPQSIPLVVSFAIWAPLARVLTRERRMGIIEGLAAGFLVGICLTFAEFVGYPLLVGAPSTQAPAVATSSASPGSPGASTAPSVRATPSPAATTPVGSRPSTSATPAGSAGAIAVVPAESVQLEAVGISNLVGYIVAVLLYPAVFRGWLMIWRGKGPATPGRRRPPVWRRLLGGGEK